MRRWNGWGDDTLAYPLPAAAARFLERLVGRGTPPRDATLADVMAALPPSRLPAHPLVSQTPDVRVRHARGQSLPDWIALRSGRVGAFPDGVAYPTTAAEVRDLLGFAAAVGAHIIPYGGGTSVVGHINPQSGPAPVLTMDMSRMNRLRRFDETNHLATFGPGVFGPDLEAQLRARLHVRPFPPIVRVLDAWRLDRHPLERTVVARVWADRAALRGRATGGPGRNAGVAVLPGLVRRARPEGDGAWLRRQDGHPD